MPSPCFPSEVKKSDLDKALTTDRVAAIWKYAKSNYIDNGVNYEETLSNVAADTGMPREWVARAFVKPKTIRNVTKELYAKQEARREAIAQAKNYVATVDTPAALKLIATLTSIPRRVLTFGHGPVFPVTHALDLLGSEPAAYFNAVGNAWKFASKAAHGAAMDWLRNHDLYVTARKAGLEIDPQRGPQGILSGGAGGWARRSWDGLKVTRLKLFEDRWNDLPMTERSPELAKDLASQINHSTGVMSPGEWGFGVISRGMFAPQLTASKIAKTFVDPIKTGITGVETTWAKIAGGEQVPFNERYIASLRTRKAATALASYAGLLAVNQGLLIASGDKERINFSDSFKGDWLKPKFAGHMFNFRGSSELVRLVGNLVAISQSSRKDLRGDTRTAAARDAVARYAQYKAEPALQLGAEMALSEDTFGRPVPWSSEKGTPSKPKYTVPEFVLSKGPIYLGGATGEIYDGLREKGISAHDALSLIRALASNPDVLAKGATIGAIEAVGGGVQKVHPPKSDKSEFKIKGY